MCPALVGSRSSRSRTRKQSVFIHELFIELMHNNSRSGDDLKNLINLIEFFRVIPYHLENLAYVGLS